jgi:Zn-finger nucleic acid-binding protein
MLDEPPTSEPAQSGRHVTAAGETLTCPCCAATMAAIGTGHGVEVDQCLECGSVWLDAGELAAILADAGPEPSGETPVATVAELRARMKTMVPSETAVRYRECPRCGEVMGRRNFGTISGVVVDECTRHGVLLDEGELQAIEAFVRMGGEPLGEQARLEHGQRTLPPPPESFHRPGEVRSTIGGEVRRTATESAAETIWNLLFRW